MKIAVIDDSKVYLKIIQKLLQKSEINNFELFNNSNQLLSKIKKEFYDVIIIDYEMPDIDGLTLSQQIKKLSPHSILIMLTALKDAKLKEKALNLGIDEFINKNISEAEFKAKMNMLKKIINYKEQLEKEIEYKEYQENLTKIKQRKIIKNELFNFFEDNIFIESYYKPKDILNGDTIFSKYIDKNSYFLAIIDAMGKGLNASLTSINATSFLEYALNKSIEYNDLNFKRLVKDFVRYVQNIIIESEILCANLICIKNNNIYVANFGMPPIYTNNIKILQNNPPINVNLDTIITETYELPDNLYIESDGILESRKKDTLYPYYMDFKSNIKKELFLKPIIKDFENKANQDDDISVIHIFKLNEIKYDKKYKKHIETKNDIDRFLKELFIKIDSHKIHYILQELLTNTNEHSLSNDLDITIKIGKYNNYKVLLFEENSKGFNIEILHTLEFEKYHGRGFKIIQNLSEAMFFNKKGNKITIFLKDDK